MPRKKARLPKPRAQTLREYRRYVENQRTKRRLAAKR